MERNWLILSIRSKLQYIYIYILMFEIRGSKFICYATVCVGGLGGWANKRNIVLNSRYQMMIIFRVEEKTRENETKQ